jgi:DNA-binding transcriptional LysR family regulator
MDIIQHIVLRHEALMNIEDLKRFNVVAATNNLQQAALELNVTAGALSKSIKRVESLTQTQLFDRVGRNIKLNAQGEKFTYYAQHLVHEADQMLSEFSSEKVQKLSISGPSVLIHHWLPKMLSKVDTSKYEIDIDIAWEGEALESVRNGKSALAVVTKIGVDGEYSKDFLRLPLGKTIFKLVAAKHHPITKVMKNNSIATKDLLSYPFACPSVSPFCGIKRSIGSDGWRDDTAPRKIAYRCNDFSMLMSLVNKARALAYVPDFIAEDHDLCIINISDFEYAVEEQIELVYRPSLAFGWLNRLIADLSR